MSVPFSSNAPAGWTVAEKVFAIGLALVTLAISGGVSWGTSQSALAQKVDRSEYLSDKAVNNARFVRDSITLAASDERARRIEIGVDSANLRLRQILCDGKPASCR